MTASPGRAPGATRCPRSRERLPARRGRGLSSSGSNKTDWRAGGHRQRRFRSAGRWRAPMPRGDPSRKRCAIYTRKSSEEGLEQEFNSLQAQCEACGAYIRSQRHEGWVLARTRYDDGGFSGGNMERPALQRLLADIQGDRIDTIVVYKVDRLTRSLADFARLVEIFDAQGASFVSVTQQFNTTSSMGRLTLNRPHTIDFIEVIFPPLNLRFPTVYRIVQSMRREQLDELGFHDEEPSADAKHYTPTELGDD